MRPDPADLYTKGRALTRDRRYREADTVLATAAAATTDPDLSARVAGTRGYVLDQLGRADEGEALCRAALADPRLTAHTRGVVEGQLGSILMHRGRLDEASALLTAAIASIPDDPLAVANLLMNRSLLSMQRHDARDAFADLEQAVVIFDALGTPVEVAEARHNLGYAALLAGDLLRAIHEMGVARPIVAEVSAANAAIADVDIADALRDAGLVTEAERLLRTAAQALRANGMPQARAVAELHLARSLLYHDPREAARVATSAARHFDALRAASWADRARGVRLRALLSGGSIDRAGRVVASARVDDADVDAVASRLAREGLAAEAVALRLSRELARARRGAPAGRMPRIDANAPLEIRMLAHEVRTERATRAGDDARVRRLAAAGLDELTAWRASFGSLDLQTSFAMHGATLMIAGIAAAVRSGDPATAFAWSERARHLSLQIVPLRPPPDPEQAAELSELRMLRADAAEGEWMSDPRAVELGERLRRRQWTTTKAADVERRVEAAEAAAALDADTAIVSYVFTGDGIACVVVTRDDARLVDLPGWPEARKDLPALRSDLDMAAAARSGAMALVVARSLDGHLERLSARLIDRVVAELSERRLVLTAPGVLAGLPWTMLPGLRGRTVTVAASVSRWVHARGRAAGAARPAVFAVGPRVARGEEEARTGAAHWPGATLLVGADATVDAVSALAAGADVLHIAAHGRHALDNPLFSGLQLADGALLGYDVDRLPHVPRTVVLSACEAGRTSVRWGEEAIGMTQAWLHGGADAVIAAPVVVADDDACEVLGAVHADLAAGLAPAEALTRATERTGIRSPFLTHGNGF